MRKTSRVAVFPVVHVWSPAQSVHQAQRAINADADGVYLIHHDGSNDDLLEAYVAVRSAVDDEVFVGLNTLGCRSSLDALSLLIDAGDSGLISDLPDGLWFDDARPTMLATADLRFDNDDLASIRYLGGASFKYTMTYSDDPEAAAAEARVVAPHVDVVCTSGPGTGQAPPQAKIAAMKSAIGTQELAIASGVDHNNLADYRPWVDEILVATSIETEPYSGVFDEAELRQLLKVAHND